MHMWKGLTLMLGSSILAAACHAEPRWCSVSSRDASNTLIYAPIAVAARVQGGAQALIIYKPNRRVEKVESVSGVPMLSGPLADQLQNWTVRTKASGDELCQTLVLVTFQLREPTRKGWKQKTKFAAGLNSISIYVSRPASEIMESEAATAARQGL
jgi:hypothetical protein